MYDKPMPLDRLLHHDVIHTERSLDNPDLFGVEVELEGRAVKTAKGSILSYWTTHADGSLRVLHEDAEAIEYVFRQPWNRKNAGEAVEALFKYLNSESVEVFKSYRTSIHVHLNFCLETHKTIYNFMTLALIFDELFVSQNGSHRIGNNFCLRSKDAQAQITMIIQSIKAGHQFLNIPPDNRYSAINFASLTKFGTIEFRSLECTTDYERVMHWIDTLQRLKTVARGFVNPQDIVKFFSRMSPAEFVHYVLGPYADKYLNVRGFDRMIHTGMRLAQDLAYCSQWVNGEPEPKKNKGIKLNKIKPIDAAIFEPNHHQHVALAEMIAAGNNIWDQPVHFLAPPHDPGLPDWLDPLQ